MIEKATVPFDFQTHKKVFAAFRFSMPFLGRSFPDLLRYSPSHYPVRISQDWLVLNIPYFKLNLCRFYFQYLQLKAIASLTLLEVVLLLYIH